MTGKNKFILITIILLITATNICYSSPQNQWLSFEITPLSAIWETKNSDNSSINMLSLAFYYYDLPVSILKNPTRIGLEARFGGISGIAPSFGFDIPVFSINANDSTLIYFNFFTDILLEFGYFGFVNDWDGLIFKWLAPAFNLGWKTAVDKNTFRKIVEDENNPLFNDVYYFMKYTGFILRGNYAHTLGFGFGTSMY